MSAVTNVMVIFGGVEGEAFWTIVKRIDKYVEKNLHKPMAWIEGEAGGEKVFDSNIYAGAFRGFDPDRFVRYVFSLKTVQRALEDVIIFIQSEGDYLPGGMRKTKLYRLAPSDPIYNNYVICVTVNHIFDSDSDN